MACMAFFPVVWLVWCVQKRQLRTPAESSLVAEESVAESGHRASKSIRTDNKRADSKRVDSKRADSKRG